MARYLILWLIFAGSVTIQATSPTAYINPDDRTRLKTLFESARPYQDLPSVHFSILGLKLLGQPLKNVQEVCGFLKSKLDAGRVESLYFVSSTNKALPTPCQLTIPATIEKSLNDGISEETSVQDLFYTAFTLKNLGLKIDSAKISKVLNTALKKEDSILNLGYAFHVATLLTDPNSIFERIEDAIVQADEVDGKFAQFEGGLSITAIVISGVYKLSEHVKKSPALDAEKCVKFSNYFISRKNVQMIRAAYYLLDVLNILTTNKYHIPVAVTLASPIAVSAAKPTVQVRVTNLLGASLGPLKVSVERAVGQGDNMVAFKPTPLLEVKSDQTLYEMNLMQHKPFSGFYKLYVNAVPVKADNRIIGNKGAVVEVKVMTQISVDGLEIGTSDVDQTTAAKMLKVDYPSKLPNILDADYHQKLQMKFSLRDKNANKNMLAHQVFVRLVNTKTKQEIIFVAEPDSSNIYTFDLDVNANAKDIGYLSGRYQLDLIVGDAVVANPFSWHVADVELTFPEFGLPQKQNENQYAPKAEINHIFREPEVRPSPVVSNTFTALTLAPLLLLVVLWIKIGVNFSNFRLSLVTIGFHLGLSGIFCLFIIFWLKLDMFSTLKYLVLIGTTTFLCGNSMLSKIAENRK